MDAKQEGGREKERERERLRKSKCLLSHGSAPASTATSLLSQVTFGPVTEEVDLCETSTHCVRPSSAKWTFKCTLVTWDENQWMYCFMSQWTYRHTHSQTYTKHLNINRERNAKESDAGEYVTLTCSCITCIAKRDDFICSRANTFSSCFQFTFEYEKLHFYLCV